MTYEVKKGGRTYMSTQHEACRYPPAVEACFSCDDCRHYDGDIRKPDQWRDTCPRRIEAKKAIEARAREMERRAQAEDRRAQAIRATFKVIKGGDGHV